MYQVLLLLVLIALQSCSSGGDYSSDLGQGYFYRSEGDNIHDILSSKADGHQIPADVVSYDYDDEFIIAKQKPNYEQDPLYDAEYRYEDGLDNYYYWIIKHEDNSIRGPLNRSAFESAKVDLMVSKDLSFE